MHRSFQRGHGSSCFERWMTPASSRSWFSRNCPGSCPSSSRFVCGCSGASLWWSTARPILAALSAPPRGQSAPWHQPMPPVTHQHWWTQAPKLGTRWWLCRHKRRAIETRGGWNQLWAAKLIIFSTQFLVLNTQFLVFNSPFDKIPCV